MKIGIIYWSGTGNTQSMAELIARGIEETGNIPVLLTADHFSPEQVSEYELLMFGCPSMGAEELEEAEFEPMFAEVLPKLSGKKAALFGSYGWGDGEWMRKWEERCREAGCQLLPDGLIVNGAPCGCDEEECMEFGRMAVL